MNNSLHWAVAKPESIVVMQKMTIFFIMLQKCQKNRQVGRFEALIISNLM
jgi:hypothetical protein